MHRKSLPLPLPLPLPRTLTLTVMHRKSGLTSMYFESSGEPMALHSTRMNWSG